MLEVQTVRSIEVSDWDLFVCEQYGRPYSFQQQDGCKGRGIEHISVPDTNGEDYEATEIPLEVNGEEMGVSFETWLKTDPDETNTEFHHSWQNELFWERNFYPDISMIINDLHSKGLLEEGEYQIVIDW